MSGPKIYYTQVFFYCFWKIYCVKRYLLKKKCGNPNKKILISSSISKNCHLKIYKGNLEQKISKKTNEKLIYPYKIAKTIILNKSVEKYQNRMQWCFFLKNKKSIYQNSSHIAFIKVFNKFLIQILASLKKL